MAKNKRIEMALFLESSKETYAIKDQDGKTVSLDEARRRWEAGELDNYNMAFGRLAQHGFDLEATKAYYDREAARLETAMTKADMLEQIEFALSELADVEAELRRIQEAPIEPARGLFEFPGARALGRCQGMADHAQLLLSMAVKNLRHCLPDPDKPIPGLFGERAPAALSNPSNLAEQQAAKPPEDSRK